MGEGAASSPASAKKKATDFSAFEDVLSGPSDGIGERVGRGRRRLTLIKYLLCAWHWVSA